MDVQAIMVLTSTLYDDFPSEENRYEVPLDCTFRDERLTAFASTQRENVLYLKPDNFSVKLYEDALS
jgi:hypothetical protein